MRIVVQRVTSGSVSVGGKEVASIGRGLLVLVGIADADTADEARRLATKIARLRVFSAAPGGGERSVRDIGGEVLVVSQFTLLADTSRGNRPSWSAAAAPDVARQRVEEFTAALRAEGVTVAEGRFGSSMAIALVNDGPLTLVLESPN